MKFCKVSKKLDKNLRVVIPINIKIKILFYVACHIILIMIVARKL